MGRKPSLTLELDSHTADAGLETRIEAFLDIVSAYRQLTAQKIIAEKTELFRKKSTIADFLNKIQEMFVSHDSLILLNRASIAKYHFYKLLGEDF